VTGPAGSRLVLVVPDLFGVPNGIARISQALVLACAQWVDARGWRLAVRALHDRGDLRDTRVCPSGVDYRGFRSDRARFAAAVVAASLGVRRPGLIFGHVNLAPLALPARLRGGRHVVITHGIEAWGPLSRARTVALRAASEVWPVSHHTGEVVVRRHGLDPSRVRPVPNCLDPLQTLRPVTAPPEGPPRFLTVSRLSFDDRYKGVDRTIEAFAEARGQLPEGARLDIAGDGDDRGRLEGLARRLGVQDAVIFHGRVSDATLEALLTACRALVLPSLREGFGLVFVEAMARGRPVIAADAAATPEVVLHGETGLLVPSEGGTELVRALCALGQDAVRAAALGVAGRARVEAAFLFPRYASDVSDRLDACLLT
jgi:phosphatidylinositol alpha-1,6-mannosyltransferase